LVASGSGVLTLGVPGTAGVTDGAVADTIVVPYNDLETLDAAIDQFGDEIAAVLVEPVAANMGLVPPAPGFLAGLRERTRTIGALLVFDEVITGFRLGTAGAQGFFDITPDLSMFGKVVGGGLPLAAVAGRADVMDVLAPVGPVYQAGTLSGNPIATAAGLAALRELQPARYDELHATATALADGLRSVFDDAGIAAQIPQVGTLVGLFFTDAPVTDLASSSASDAARYATFFHGMLDRGVFLAPSSYEVLFPGLAHTPDDVERTIAAARAVVETL